MNLKKKYDQARWMNRIIKFTLFLGYFVITSPLVNSGVMPFSVQLIGYLVFISAVSTLSNSIFRRYHENLVKDYPINFTKSLMVADIEEFYQYLILRAKDLNGKGNSFLLYKSAFQIHTLIYTTPFPYMKLLIERAERDFNHNDFDSMYLYESQSVLLHHNGEYDKLRSLYKKMLEYIKKCYEAGTLPEKVHKNYNRFVESISDLIKVIETKDEELFEKHIYNAMNAESLVKILGAYKDYKMATDFGFTRSIPIIKNLVSEMSGDIPWLTFINEE